MRTKLKVVLFVFIDEYNRTVKQCNAPKLCAYVKAWSVEMRPSLLAMASTASGFLPFIIDASKEVFGFPLAAGIIGGLVFALASIPLVLPLFILKRTG